MRSPVALRAYNRFVTVTLNRAILVLAFAGLFVAGVLSLGHALNVSVPCGPGGGCDTVAKHPSSYWGGIPVAYFGVVGYLLIAGLAIARAFGGLRKPALSTAGFALTAVGFLASVYLQWVSLTQIRALCPWCLASAAIMLLLLIAHGVLASRETPEDLKANSMIDTGLVAALALATVVALGIQTVQLQRAGRLMPIAADLGKPEVQAQLLPDGVNYYGPADAPITVVEFADLFCQACRESMGKMKELVDGSNGKVRWVFRHFPLYTIHPDAFRGAVAAEMAAEKNRMFELLAAINQFERGQAERLGDLLPLMRQLGFTDEEVLRRVADKDDPAFGRAYRDLETADALGLNRTPTLFVMMEGTEPRAVSSNELPELLAEPRYQQVIQGNAGR